MKFLRLWKARILIFFAVVGPGFITANVDNDAGGIYTYSAAGAQFGHLLLWTMIPITLALIVVQEMSARMGAATGKGLSDLIREEFGLRITFFMMIAILITNFGNVIAEFAGIAGSLELFGLRKYYTVPICAVIVWLIVVKGQYKSVEKVFLAASFFYVTYIFAGVIAKPAWMEALVATVKPPPKAMFLHQDYLYMVIAVVGTTIAPWMQFYLQSSIVEKGVTKRQYRASQLDVISGCILTLSTAYTVCEGLGFESGVGKKFDEAPAFYWLYTLLIAAGAGVILTPNLPLVKITVLSQVVNGIVLPFVLIFMLLLVNKKSLMGEYVNSRFFNVIAWATTVIMIGLTVALLWRLRAGAG